MELEILDILHEIAPQYEIDLDTNLLNEIIDSMSLLILINELEDKYLLEVPLDEVKMADFENVIKITEFVEKLQKSQQEV